MQDAPSCASTDHYIICVSVCVFYLKTQILRHKGIMQNNWKMRPDFNQPIFSYIQCLTYQVVQQDKEKQLLHNLHSYKNLHQSKLPYILEDREEKKKRKEKKRKEEVLPIHHNRNTQVRKYGVFNHLILSHHAIWKTFGHQYTESWNCFENHSI